MWTERERDSALTKNCTKPIDLISNRTAPIAGDIVMIFSSAHKKFFVVIFMFIQISAILNSAVLVP